MLVPMIPSSSACQDGEPAPATQMVHHIVAFIERTPGRRLVIAIDGRTGAGKTTFGRRIAGLVGEPVCILEVESFIEGWNGLSSGVQSIAQNIVIPFKDKGCAHAREWDWHRGRWRGTSRIPAVGQARVLLLVGCGSSSAALAPHLDASLWIDCPEELRRARVRAREGDPGTWWDLWTRQENELLADHDSPARATWRVQSTPRISTTATLSPSPEAIALGTSTSTREPTC